PNNDRKLEQTRISTTANRGNQRVEFEVKSLLLSSCPDAHSSVDQFASPCLIVKWACSHSKYNDFLRSPGRAASSEGLYGARRHLSSVSRFFGVLCHCRRRLREQRRQQGSYSIRPSSGWPAFSRNRQNM
ncbi:hypothetical protein MMC31_008010, partial [Peltigera leucophlebia]|nr:hypothetical protein [Peltigera leucophlebia]